MSGITPSASWRNTIPIHPAAALFPRPSGDELVALGEDIRERGVLFPIAFYQHRDGTVSLLDGVSRLDAMERVGVGFEIIYKKKRPYLRVGDDPDVVDAQKETQCVFVHDNPHSYVVAVNIRRRHLTTEQKRELIAKLLKLDPGKSDRQIAETVKASPTTVGKVRADLETTGDVSKLDTRTDTKGRQQPARKPPPESEQIDLEDAIAAGAETSAAARKQAYAAAEQPSPPEDTASRKLAEAVAYLCWLVQETGHDPLMAERLAAIVAAHPKPLPVGAIDRVNALLTDVASRLRKPEHAEPLAGDPGPVPGFLQRSAGS